MALIEIPHLRFDPWKRWTGRDRPSQEFDVPESFGILGLYVLAVSHEGPPAGQPAFSSEELPEAIVYVGMSTHVDRRLELAHKAVSRYREDSSDLNCANLWCARWYSDWSNSPGSSDIVVQLATIAVYERALIHAYASKYGRLPKFNRE